MRVFERLCIGTANWHRKKPYGHRGVVCPLEEQNKILAYCQSVGIDTIHTKKAYDVDLSPVLVNSYFRIVCEDALDTVKSFYDVAELVQCGKEKRWSIVQIPYSVFDRRWESTLWRIKEQWADEVWVRSCFLQGKVFSSDEPVFLRFRGYAEQVGIPIGTLCILFCLLNPHVDKVILGVDSAEQLREDLRFFHKLGSFLVDDLNVIDPRKW